MFKFVWISDVAISVWTIVYLSNIIYILIGGIYRQNLSICNFDSYFVQYFVLFSVPRIYHSCVLFNLYSSEQSSNKLSLANEIDCLVCLLKWNSPQSRCEYFAFVCVFRNSPEMFEIALRQNGFDVRRSFVDFDISHICKCQTWDSLKDKRVRPISELRLQKSFRKRLL